MTERAKNCTSSGLPLTETGSTTFPCPNCGYSIGRSPRCRDQGVSYTCPECGFVGP
ncbi:MAG: RNA-binding protein [Euryarchaeota archaeon]|nr:RNA-binding protein [Euryarchaeota archaeon]MBF15146.1 RNA-binding protein [Euryarchaeota archaeon]